jgi:hypothetical protein
LNPALRDRLRQVEANIGRALSRTVFLGVGASAPVGLPDWDTLARRLLGRADRRPAADLPKALNADIRDYGHDHGHRVLTVTRKGARPTGRSGRRATSRTAFSISRMFETCSRRISSSRVFAVASLVSIATGVSHPNVVKRQ